MRTIYLHGAPGSPAELEGFGAPTPGWSAPDRFVDRVDLPFSAYLDVFARDLEAAADAAPLRLVGFSAGARVALEIAGRLKGRVSRIELISPVAPFELGAFLPRMAGRNLFALARGAPYLFPGVTWLMSRLGDGWPKQLFNLVFADPAGADAALVRDPSFAAAALASLRRSNGPGAPGYAREILACVRPWDVDLATIEVPVRIWQGSVDNWTPPDMAGALQARLPNAEPMRLLAGLSHYSTLRHALGELAVT
jgi:pimeloyl-ACP methyl ester carboxylesterase